MPDSTKRMLLLKACDDNQMELYNVASQAKLYGIECEQPSSITSEDELKRCLRDSKYDYIYLCTHGAKNCFGNNCDFEMSWSSFASAICESKCMNPGGIFFLACCRGGLHQVAHTLFYYCPNIEFICGPRFSLNSAELLIGFNIFMYNIEQRRTDPVIAAKKIESATDLRFTCFDREETESSTEYFIYKGEEGQRQQSKIDCPTCA